MEHLTWDIYEISSEQHSLIGVKCRGRIRKYGLENSINVLAENASDAPGNVRFALVANSDPSSIEEFLTRLFHDIKIEKVLPYVPNPVLSKLDINDATRYEI
tara:strand:- start:2665 stop:2970 length:306 start_codon:yes stop_codon:yes gene_type:complete